MMKDETHDTGERQPGGGSMSMMYLLFEEKGELPSANVLYAKIEERGYKFEIGRDGNDDSPTRHFHLFLPEYTVDFADKKGMPYQLLMIDFTEIEKPLGSETDRTQFETPGGAELLDACKWQVFVSDFASSTHPAQTRARILSDWLEIALDLFPDCKAVWFDGSRNVMTAGALRHNPYRGANRIFHGAVNVRFFNIEGTKDMLVDTLGLQVFGIPDVQFHFHDLDPNRIVKFAGDIAMYQFENDVPINDGETVDGFYADDNPGKDIRWKCQYEISLLEPEREVLDVNTGANASGNREKE
ncbi:MAG: DUF4261 domain-containing protein [Tannerella sp.]|jgi:hypothetical protein|nr:DUF4261 domain-containing protein [Tannerella sp.]